MKKVVTGFAVLIVFAAYSLGIRHKNPVLAKPQSPSSGSNTSYDTPATSNTSFGSGTPPQSSPAPKSYKDGTYTGSVADAYYGNVQVQAIINGGKIANVKFLQYPDTHQTSVIINQQAMPYLQQEAIQSQSASVQIISGATFTSQAFQQSLQAALSQA